MIDEDGKAALRSLVGGRATAALGTIHHGGPFVSMVPFAVLPDGSRFVLHVSRLAAHTADMLSDPRVSLLVVEHEGGATRPQALARLTVTGEAALLDPAGPGHDAARAAYLAKFPEAEGLFSLGDFSLFTVAPRAARFIGGFARAFSVPPDDLVRILASGA